VYFNREFAMSHLIQLRQRLKAIETIKKITNAMRIISRSLHTRMNKQRVPLVHYQATLEKLLTQLKTFEKEWKSPLFSPDPQRTPQELYILIGAQKGLCGNFNAEFLYWLEHQKDILQHDNVEIITIGKQTFEAVKPYKLNVIQQHEELKKSTLSELTKLLIKKITQAKPYYTNVTIVGTIPQTFFVQRLEQRTIIPFKQDTTIKDDHDYTWLNQPETVLDQLAHLYLETTIYNTLFESLLGEQAARFIAMDNATRNANKFIDRMQLQYNKLRQAKITKELSELTANF
jgi:F-type H+-transporting ATPase subunit gamma